MQIKARFYQRISIVIVFTYHDIEKFREHVAIAFITVINYHIFDYCIAL